jgi:hypothetical protein
MSGAGAPDIYRKFGISVVHCHSVPARNRVYLLAENGQ